MGTRELRNAKKAPYSRLVSTRYRQMLDVVVGDVGLEPTTR